MLRAMPLFAVVTVALCGCATHPPDTAAAAATDGIREVQAAAVVHCTALPTVVGSNAQPAALQNGVLTALSFGSARAVALKKARDEGATHLVWGDEIVGGAGSFITARPYRCDQVASN